MQDVTKEETGIALKAKDKLYIKASFAGSTETGPGQTQKQRESAKLHCSI